MLIVYARTRMKSTGFTIILVVNRIWIVFGSICHRVEKEIVTNVLSKIKSCGLTWIFVLLKVRTPVFLSVPLEYSN